MPLINYEVTHQLTFYKTRSCTVANKVSIFKITGTKLYATLPVATLSTQKNIKLLKQLESGFKRTTNWNKYSKKEVKFKTDI